MHAISGIHGLGMELPQDPLGCGHSVDVSSVSFGTHHVQWDECMRLLLSTGLEPERLREALGGTGLHVPLSGHQAENRPQRVALETGVNVHHVGVAEAFDDDMLAILQNKREAIAQLLAEGGTAQ